MRALSPEEWHGHLQAGQATIARHGLARGFGLRAVRHQPFRSGVMSACLDHVIAVRLAGRAEAERTLGGRFGRAITYPGSLTIVPAGQESSWFINGTGELLHMFMPTGLLARVADELDLRPELATELLGCLGCMDGSIAAIARTALKESVDGLDGSDMMTEALSIQLAILIIRRYSASSRQPAIERSALSPTIRRHLIDFVEANLDRTISLSEICRIAGLAPSRFSERFKATFQMTPHAYVLDRRVVRAMGLLVETRRTLSDIAFSTGFANQSHFTRVFREKTGMTPSAYRSEVRPRG